MSAVIVGAMVLLAILYTVALPFYMRYQVTEVVTEIVRHFFKFVIVQFFIVGVLMSTLCKTIAEKYMIKSDKKGTSSGGTGGAGKLADQ